jgi:hypothetical protein
MEFASTAEHVFSGKSELHPLYDRALGALALGADSIKDIIVRRTAMWCGIADRCEGHRTSWLASLPSHCRSLYCTTKFNGAAFEFVHRHLLDRGYSDHQLMKHLSEGFPCGLLEPTGLWPSAPKLEEKLADAISLSTACDGTPLRLSSWSKSRKPDAHFDFLEACYKAQEKGGRCRRTTLEELSKHESLVHPTFVIDQITKLRCIMDCTAGELNSCTVSREKLALPTVDDVLDFAARLHAARPNCRPRLAVADEEGAFKNWPNANPFLHVAAVQTKSGLKLFLDFALSLGDVSSVYAYPRIRTALTVFFISEFFIPVWSYFDDSMLVFTQELASTMWHAFLKIHAVLGVPIQGNPLDRRTSSDPEKLRSPKASNIALGEQLSVGTWPTHAEPTKRRLDKCEQMLRQILKQRQLSPAASGSAAGQLRFLSSALYGRVGVPALASLHARQHESISTWSPAIEASCLWLLETLGAVGPRQWLWGMPTTPPITLFGDASEPGDPSAPRICAAVLCQPGQQTQFFSVAVPDRLLTALSARKKQICLLELLWVVLSLAIWGSTFQKRFVTVYDDNEGAKFAILRGMSRHFDLNIFLAVFWGASAHADCKIWAEWIKSSDNPADCLTKSGLDNSHLQGALDVSKSVDWPKLFDYICRMLEKRTLPSLSDATECIGRNFAVTS